MTLWTFTDRFPNLIDLSSLSANKEVEVSLHVNNHKREDQSKVRVPRSDRINITDSLRCYFLMKSFGG